MTPETRHHVIAGAAMLRAGFPDYAEALLELAPGTDAARRLLAMGQHEAAMAVINTLLQQEPADG